MQQEHWFPVAGCIIANANERAKFSGQKKQPEVSLLQCFAALETWKKISKLRHPSSSLPNSIKKDKPIAVNLPNFDTAPFQMGGDVIHEFLCLCENNSALYLECINQNHDARLHHRAKAKRTKKNTTHFCSFITQKTCQYFLLRFPRV